jgi:tRNA A37 N6-isopentenylltransferase MiaA
LISRATWQYAKRQMTWFCADRSIAWFGPDQFKKIKKTVEVFQTPPVY